MNENLTLYERFRAVPENAKKPIKGGRLKGKTDINPLWRIKSLTEQFGPCGIGWKAPIRKQWIEPGANGEMMAFCNIELFIKVDGAWSDGIDGTGGAAAVSKENGGFYTDDECFKKAYTDAISVACKMLGLGADVYWEKDSTKYDGNPPAGYSAAPSVLCSCCGSAVKSIKTKDKTYTAEEFAAVSGGLCYECYKNSVSNKVVPNDPTV